MTEPAITVRPIDFARDTAPLASFLGERDRLRLEHSEAAVRDGDCFIYVADDDGTAFGWAVVHTNFRDDQDWDPPDDDTVAFQQGDNAYLEQIEVTASKPAVESRPPRSCPASKSTRRVSPAGGGSTPYSCASSSFTHPCEAV